MTPQERQDRDKTRQERQDRDKTRKAIARTSQAWNGADDFVGCHLPASGSDSQFVLIMGCR